SISRSLSSPGSFTFLILRSAAICCSWQSRFLAHFRQSSGWSESSNSTTALLALTTFGLSVLISIPSLQKVAQEGRSLPLPQSSTIQTLQDASLLTKLIFDKSIWQRVGIIIFKALAADRIVVFSLTTIS